MDRYRIQANICMGDDLYKYKSFTVHAESIEDARKKLSSDWNIEHVRKMARKELER